MKLYVGNIVQYKDDDWSYVVMGLNPDSENGQILYECLSPEGESRGCVWCHTIEDVELSIEQGKILVIGDVNSLKPIKQFPKHSL